MINTYSQSTSGGSRINAKGFVLASVLVGALALPLFMSGQRVQAQNENREHSGDLLGSWIVQFTLDPNSVPPGTPLNFMGLYTFSAGGGYVQSNTGPGSGGPPVYGNWYALGTMSRLRDFDSGLMQPTTSRVSIKSGRVLPSMSKATN